MAVISSTYLEHHLNEKVDLNASTTSFANSLTSVVPLIEKASIDTDNNFLVVSPYDERPHLLDLRTLDIPNQLLAKALVILKCLREDYATAPYVEIFNWTEVVDAVRHLSKESEFEWKETSFYIVVFRSRIPPSTIYADLHTLDKDAHVEATKSGGFLK